MPTLDAGPEPGGVTQTAAVLETHAEPRMQSGYFDDPTKAVAPVAGPKFKPKTEMLAPPVAAPLTLTEVKVTAGASKVNAVF